MFAAPPQPEWLANCAKCLPQNPTVTSSSRRASFGPNWLVVCADRASLLNTRGRSGWHGTPRRLGHATTQNPSSSAASASGFRSCAASAASSHMSAAVRPMSSLMVRSAPRRTSNAHISRRPRIAAIINAAPTHVRSERRRSQMPAAGEDRGLTGGARQVVGRVDLRAVLEQRLGGLGRIPDARDVQRRLADGVAVARREPVLHAHLPYLVGAVVLGHAQHRLLQLDHPGVRHVVRPRLLLHALAHRAAQRVRAVRVGAVLRQRQRAPRPARGRRGVVRRLVPVADAVPAPRRLHLPGRRRRRRLRRHPPAPAKSSCRSSSWSSSWSSSRRTAESRDCQGEEHGDLDALHLSSRGQRRLHRHRRRSCACVRYSSRRKPSW